jgi:hypothetical protein
MNTSTWTPWAEDIVAENWKGLADHLHINRSIRIKTGRRELTL